MKSNIEKELVANLTGVFRQSVDVWQKLHPKWSFDLLLGAKRPVILMVCVLDNRKTKWFDLDQLDELQELVKLIERRFKMGSKRWIREGEVEFKFWLKRGEYAQKRTK